MNDEPKLYNKLKRYYKLLLSDRYKLDGVHFNKHVCFEKFMSQLDIVDYPLDQDKVLKIHIVYTSKYCQPLKDEILILLKELFLMNTKIYRDISKLH